MSYANAIMEACPDTQLALTEFHKGCDPSFLREPMPHWDWVWSDTNSSGFQQVIVPSDGQVRTLIVTIEQRLLESEAADVSSCDLNCKATKVRGNLTKSYSIDPCDAVEASELLDAKQFMYVCEKNPSVIARKIQRLIDVVIRRLATRLVNRSTALVGGWADYIDAPVVGNALQVKTRKDGSSTDPHPFGWQDLNFAMQQSSFCDLPTVIMAGATLHKYAGISEKGCCTSAGWDIGAIFQTYGKAVLYDKRVQKALGSNFAWAMQAGSLIPLYFTLNGARNEANQAARLKLGLEGDGRNYAAGVLADPRSGFPLDVVISDDCGKISIIVRGNADIKTLPDEMFPPGDDYEGVTGFAKIQVANVA